MRVQNVTRLLRSQGPLKPFLGPKSERPVRQNLGEAWPQQTTPVSRPLCLARRVGVGGVVLGARAKTPRTRARTTPPGARAPTGVTGVNILLTNHFTFRVKYFSMLFSNVLESKFSPEI